MACLAARVALVLALAALANGEGVPGGVAAPGASDGEGGALGTVEAELAMAQSRLASAEDELGEQLALTPAGGEATAGAEEEVRTASEELKGLEKKKAKLLRGQEGAMAGGSGPPGGPAGAQVSVDLLFVGLLPRYADGVSTPDYLPRNIWPSVRLNVVDPAVARGGGRVRLMGHVWASHTQAEATRASLRAFFAGVPGAEVGTVTSAPQVESYKGERESQRYGWFHAVERALAVQEGEGDPHAVVLLMRWDVVLFRPFEAHLLSRQMVYRANWCKASGPDHPKAPACRRMGPWPFDAIADGRGDPCDDGGGVPDFVFSGGAGPLRAAFVGALADLQQGLYRATNCGVNHGLINGRLEYVREARGVVLGRYMYHFLDYDFVRVGREGRRFWTQRRSECLAGLPAGEHDAPYLEDLPGGGTRLSSSAALAMHNVSEPQGPSVCGGGALSFCLCRHGDMGYIAFTQVKRRRRARRRAAA